MLEREEGKRNPFRRGNQGYNTRDIEGIPGQEDRECRRLNQKDNLGLNYNYYYSFQEEREKEKEMGMGKAWPMVKPRQRVKVVENLEVGLEWERGIELAE